MCSRGIMRPLLSFSVCLWTFLHFSALLKTSQAECVHCSSSETEVVTGTTTITVRRSNCTISAGNSVSVNGLIAGLTPGAVYQIFFNCSSCCTNVTTKPGAVGDLTVTEVTTSSLSLNWTNPVGNSLFYRVQWSDGNFWPTETVNDTSINITNLTAGVQYNITVTAVADDGQTEGATTSVQRYTMPNTVTGLNASDLNTTAIRLTWERQSDYKDSYAYIVEAFQDVVMVENISTTKETYIFSHLIPGTLYNFSVYTSVFGIKSTVAMTSRYTRPDVVSNITAIGSTTTMSVSWIPAKGRVDSYTFQLYRDGTLVPCNNSLSNTTVNYTCLNLNPGVLYCVVVVTKSGPLESNSSDVCNATFPNPPGPITVVSQTVESISFTWTFPDGMDNNSYNFSVSSINGSYLTKNNWFLLDNLEPGSPYNISVVTVGVMDYKSTAVTAHSYTRPDVVSNIMAIGSTTTMSVSWIPAKGRVDSYTVQLNRNRTLVPCNKSLSNTTVNYTCLNLNPGVLYCVVVVTKSGPLESNSSDVCNATFPNPPGPITVVSQTVESINFTWTFPDGMDNNSYNFSVSGIKGSYLTTNNWFLLDNLEPGSPYNISVVTVGVMDYKSTAVTAHNYTNASSVKHLTCEGPNTTNAQIILSWTKPSGQYSAFRITVNNDKINNTEKSCCNHTVSGLVHYTEYTLSVTTESWGQPSAPVTHQCRTGITNPPIPPNYESLVEVTNTVYNRFSLQIDSSLLNNTNGPITDVGVLVTDSILDNTSDLKVYLGKTYKEWKAKATPVYLATVRNATNLKRSVNVYLSIDVGDESTLENYDNGALEATGRYRYAIVLFTRLSLQNKLVNGQTSLVSITKFYPAVPLPLNPVILAVAVAMGIFIIFVIFLIGFIIYWRRVSNKQPSDIQFQSMRAKVSVAVRVEDFEAYYKKQNSDSSCGFAEEFEELKPVGTSQSKTNGLNLENKPKNRYNNVLPYDSSRVKLSIIHGSPYDDYINANYMPGHNSRKEFIAAQGPLPATVDEFWRMIWEKNVQTMVMLTRCHEQGRIKCEQYWGSGTKYFENITVTTISEIPLEDWTIRDFNIKNVKTAETRTVRHFHFTAWPDHGVPQTTELLISFRHLVREHMDQYSRNSPTVVHCSAGVGRTGTFIAIDRLIFQIERENIVDVFGIVHDLRMHRPLMVQTEDQYVFLNQCAMDIIRSRTGNNVDLIYQNAAAFSIYENVEPQRKHGYNNA